MSVSRTAIVGSMLLGGGLVLAADDVAPDPEFLEYLGFWAESDEDWLLFEEPVTAEAEEPKDPAPEGGESAEKTDES